jgi:DNA replication and repair protein RecF
MAVIRTIRVQHIRTHKDFSLSVSPKVTVITGKNGSGKTSVIEAVTIALQGSSFKGVDDELLAQDAPWYRIDIESDDGLERTVKFDPALASGRKQFIIDGKSHHRMPVRHKYPIVLFEPEDLRLLNGSPVRRRQFIDRFISQLDPKYSMSLRRYERALRQRNVLLKQRAPSNSLFAWDVSLSEYGAYVVDQRIRFISELNQQLNTTYETIARAGDIVCIRYSQPTESNTSQKLLADLHLSAEKDAILGFTSSGPHRHDVLFDFNDAPAVSTASRGEVRSIVLALKFLEVDIIEKITDKKPIILLDDVFSELDTYRQNQLISLTKENQIIITSATNNSNIHTDYIVKL